MTTVYEFFRSVSDRYGDREAIVFPDTRITYADLRAEVEMVGEGLVAAGVRPGTHVGSLIANCREIVVLFFAVARAGAIWVPLNPRYRTEELSYTIEHSNIELLITTDRLEPHVDLLAILRECVGPWNAQGFLVDRGQLSLERIFCISDRQRDDIASYSALKQNSSGATAPARSDDRDPFSIMYTSGTTNRPKGVLVPHVELIDQQLIIQRDRLKLPDGAAVYSPLPLYHFACYIPLICALSVGGTLVTLEHFDAAAASRLVERERCVAAWTGFDTMAEELAEQSADLSTVRVDALIGPPSKLRKLEAMMPNCKFLQIFGGTEAGGCACLPTLDDDISIRTETSGFPIGDAEIIAMSESGSRLAAGEQGELCVRGPAVARGYYRDPDNPAFDANGWYHTGDLGLIDENGRVVFRGRLKDLIKVGGENVTAAEIESFFLEHPKVRLVQVVGVPDDRYSEVPAAFVELESGVTCTEAELREFAVGKIARVRIPKYIRFVDEWPMSTTKIQKEKLRDGIVRELGLDRDLV